MDHTEKLKQLLFSSEKIIKICEEIKTDEVQGWTHLKTLSKFTNEQLYTNLILYEIVQIAKSEHFAIEKFTLTKDRTHICSVENFYFTNGELEVRFIVEISNFVQFKIQPCYFDMRGITTTDTIGEAIKNFRDGY